MELTIPLTNSEETDKIGRFLGMLLEKGDVLLLLGDLGAGKTTLAKGIAKGLEIAETVKSPTYTLIREYTSGRIPLYHMDVYRIDGEIEDMGIEEYFDGDGVCLVEWGNLIDPAFLEDYIKVRIEKNETNESMRTMKLESNGKRSHQILTQLNKESREN